MGFKKHIGNFFRQYHRLVLTCAIITCGFVFLFPAFALGMENDVRIYRGVADDLLRGKMPYRDHVVEYPPYAIPIFLLPRIFGQNNYLDCFRWLALSANWFVSFLLFAIGLRQSKTTRALLPLLLYCAAVPFLRFFFLQRYDVFPALLCVIAIWLFCTNRHFLCGLAVAAGIGIKVYPAVFVPPMFIVAMREGKGKQFLAGLGLGLLPLAILSFFLPWWRFVGFHAARGLQVESLYASVLWLAKLLGLTRLDWEYVGAWYEIHGSLASTLLPYARLLFVGSTGVSTVLVVRAALSISPSVSQKMEKKASETSSISTPQLARLLLVPLLPFVAFNQVLSPQYMVWLLPLAALSSMEGSLVPATMISIAAMLTPLIFPSLNDDYGTGLDLFETLVLLIRNLVLVGVWIQLIREMLVIIRSKPKDESSRSMATRLPKEEMV